MTQAAFTLAAPVVPVEWKVAHKGNPALIALADRHYTRQTPGSSQACRPGVNLCLVTTDGLAAWVVWRPIPDVGRMDNLEAWECTLFRNESSVSRSSDLVRDASDMTFKSWGWPPRDGLITAVGIKETAARRSRRSPPGTCFLAAGWVPWQHPNPTQNELKAWLRAPRPGRTERKTP